MRIAPLEESERALEGWAAEVARQHIPFDAALGELSARSARARGLDWPAPAQLELIAASLPPLSEVALREPHVLGWLFQHSRAEARHQSFAAHVHDGARHEDTLRSTQIFTPRWAADVMIDRAIEGWDAPTPPIVCDPAMGGGQLLLAALDLICDRWPELTARQVIRCLRGVDLDARAVHVARIGLAQRLQERFGTMSEAHRGELRARLTTQDALALLDAPRSVDITLTNPPYMGRRSMPDALRAQLDALITADPSWRAFTHDLGVVFARLCARISRHSVAILGQQTLWYTSRFERARRALYDEAPPRWFGHLGAGVFGALSGEKASVALSVHDVRPDRQADQVVCVDARHTDSPQAQRDHIVTALEHPPAPLALGDFLNIPGAPMAHDLPQRLMRWFTRADRLGDLMEIPGSQNKTGDNKQYVRRWDEVDRADIHHTRGPWPLSPSNTPGRWRFYSKGGPHAPWWGNWHHVIDWSEAARDFYATNRTSNLLAERFWEREGLCYTDFGGRRFNARWLPAGCVFDMTGPAIFCADDTLPDPERRQRLLATLALLNASPARTLLNALNPSIHYQVRDVRNLPIPPRFADLTPDLAIAAHALVTLTHRRHHHLPGDPLHDPAADPDALATIDAEIARLVEVVEALAAEVYG